MSRKCRKPEHSLQTATRAEKAGADIDWIVTSLLHDIGDWLAPANHSKMASEVLAPYVREECTWVLRHHAVFQQVYYGHFIGEDPNARDRYKDSPYYQSCADFCEFWDQASFDPEYESYPLTHFERAVREVFDRSIWDDRVVRTGSVVGVPH